MRFSGRAVLFGLAVSMAAALAGRAADEPPPLLKSVTPAAGQVRVRVPVTPGHPKTMQMSAQVPRGKKKSELIDVVVTIDSLPNPSYVSVKKLEGWGYDVPKGSKEFLLPELLVTMSQIAPKPAKSGTDVVVRLTNIKLTVVETPASSDDTIYMSDMSLSAAALYQGNERVMEPRLSFGNHFLEMSIPPAILKRPGTDAVMAPEVTANTDPTLAPAVAPMTPRNGLPVFAYAAVNGQDTYKVADGSTRPVNVMVSSVCNWETGVVVTIGLARGCKVDMEAAAAGMAATGVEGKSEMIPGKMKELRLGLYTGPNMKEKKDLVIKDVPVVVDRNISEGYVYIGQKFIDAHFKDGVYAGGGDGWKLHGRVSADLLYDIKTRKKP